MIVVDTSALVAIFRREPGHDRFRKLLQSPGPVAVSAGTAVELAAVTGRSAHLREEANRFLDQPFVRIEPVTAEQARMASAAFRAWGKGHHPAGLNLGDMFAYLLARERNLPLLFKGNDFSRTDVRNAMDEA